MPSRTRKTVAKRPAARAPAIAKKKPPVVEPRLRTGVDAHEGWENHERKREWFLRTRDIAEGQSRTRLRLQAIGEVEAQMKTEAAAKGAPPGAVATKPGGGVEVIGAPRGAGVRTTLLGNGAQPQAKALLAGAVRLSAKVDPVGATLRITVGAAALKKVVPGSIRMFRLEASNDSWQLVPNSGFDAARRCAWVQLHRAGTYAPIGLPAAAAESTRLIEGFNEREDSREAAAASKSANLAADEPAQWQLLRELACDRRGLTKPPNGRVKSADRTARRRV